MAKIKPKKHKSIINPMNFSKTILKKKKICTIISPDTSASYWLISKYADLLKNIIFVNTIPMVVRLKIKKPKEEYNYRKFYFFKFLFFWLTAISGFRLFP